MTYSVLIVVKKNQKCRIFEKCENFTSFVFSAMPQPRYEGSKLVSQSKAKKQCILSYQRLCKNFPHFTLIGERKMGHNFL